ncbi:hypothetical protein GCM10022247_70610 [Allokutzneria multivorans]|uniref:Uncharacterized protein n=2 Tax=Allokutzneria multivorans TaxID=1142134 RepID=A0ABP7U2R8_9PSEU
MWEDADHKGSRYVHQKAVTGFYDIDNWDGDNEISSVINNSACSLTMYSNDTRETSFLKWTVRSEQDIPNLQDVALPYLPTDLLTGHPKRNANDEAESFTITC